MGNTGCTNAKSLAPSTPKASEQLQPSPRRRNTAPSMIPNCPFVNTTNTCGSKLCADDEETEPASAAAPAGATQPEPEVGPSSGPLSVATRIEYAAIPRGRAQDIFGLVTVQAAAAAADAGTKGTEKRQALDVVCVLDVSGSMCGEKLSLVQNAVRFVVQESQPEDRLSLVTFQSHAERVLRLRRMHREGKDEATAAVLRLSAGGGTDIASGLESALQVVERRRHRNPVAAILLLTDGQDGSSRGTYAPLLERAQRAGCSLYAFGFGADHDARMLAQIAELSQNPFTFVEDVEQIGAAFAGAVGGLSSVAAQRVAVTLTSSVPLKAIHTPFPTTREGSRCVVQIPDMLAGERRDMLVEMSVPLEKDASEGGTLLLAASARYHDLAVGATRQTAAVDMRLARSAEGPDEPQPEQEPDEDVMAQRDRVEVAQTLQRAAACGDAGDFNQAQRLLSAQEERLSVRCSKGKSGASPLSQAMQAELQDARQRMRTRVEWEGGGRAELRDACQMHCTQRTTNISMSPKCSSPQKRMSKEMYATPTQKSWISKSLG